MINMKYLILLLPLVYARYQHDGITVSIEPAPTEANTTILQKGEDTKIVTDSDIAAFNLTTDNLANAVETYSGEKGTDIFLKSPTPWNDLYKSYNWREVKREFKIKDIRLINVTNEEVNLSVTEFSNNDTESKLVKGQVIRGYDTFLSRHYWSGNEEVSAIVWYNLTRPYDPPLGYGYTSKVGQDSFGSGVFIITYTESRAKFTLKPGQTAKFYIKANKVTTRIVVEYETSLIGDVVVAVNYENKHEGHHFWAYDINQLMSASNMTATVKSKEYIEVYYLKDDYKTQIVDASSGQDIEFTKGFLN